MRQTKLAVCQPLGGRAHINIVYHIVSYHIYVYITRLWMEALCADTCGCVNVDVAMYDWFTKVMVLGTVAELQQTCC